MMVDTNTAATMPVVSAATPRPAANAALEGKAPQSKSVETPSYDALLIGLPLRRWRLRLQTSVNSYR